MKTFNIICCVMFLLFAGLQYNDPDPFIWIPLYLIPALLCGLAAAGKRYPVAYLLVIAGYGAYAAYKIFEKDGLVDWVIRHDAENIAGTMKATQPWIEEAREFFGLAIIIVVLVINYRYAVKKIRLGRVTDR